MSVSDMISAYGLELYPHERTVSVRGRPVMLTAREFDILAHLAAHPGWVYSADQLADGDEGSSDSSPDSIRVHVAHLRQKLALAEADGIITTVRGVGYRLQGQQGQPHGVTTNPGTLSVDRTPPLEPTRAVSRELRDAFWLLERAVIEIEQAGTNEQLLAASRALDDVRGLISGLLGHDQPGTR